MRLKSIVISLTILSSLFFIGCMGGRSGDASGGLSVSRLFSPGGKEGKKRQAALAPRGGSREREHASAARRSGESGTPEAELSPEASMRRDLDRLVDKEREQVAKLQQIKNLLAEGEETYASEETRLAEIRTQIERYDDALRRYNGIARSPAAPGRETAEWHSRLDRPDTKSVNVARGMEREAPPAREEYARRDGPSRSLAEGEVLIYDSAADGEYLAAMERRGMPQVKREFDPNAPAPYAGATVSLARSEAMPPLAARGTDDEPEWNPPPSPSLRRDAEVAVASPMRGAAKPPIRIQAGAPAETMPQRGGNPPAEAVDEAFVPDIFLASGR